MNTGLLIQDTFGNYVPLCKVTIPRYIGGRGYVYEPEFFPESQPEARYSEYEIYQMRQTGRVCRMDQVVTVECAA